MPVPSFVQSLGPASNTALACTPGGELWVTPGGSYTLTFWVNASFCPASGVVNVGPLTNTNGTVQSALSTLFGAGNWPGATVFEDTRMLSADPADPGGGGGGTVSGELTLAPFEYTPEQQAEIYQSLAVVFGLFLGALALAWALKSIIRLLGWHGNAAD